MKTILITLLGACLPVALAAQALRPMDEAVALEAFGQSGESIPHVARELLPDGFFSQDLIRAAADGDNYSAVIDLQDLLAVTPELSRLTLFLTNRSEHPNDVVISAPAVGSRPTRNFLVRIEASSSRQVDVSSLAAVPSVYFLSLQDFSARVEIRRAGIKVRQADAVILAPARVEGGAGLKAGGKLCRNQSTFCTACEETISICSGGSCAVATASRSFWTTSAGHDYYKVNVHYPVNGPIFHCHSNSFAQGIVPQCKYTKQTTFRPVNAGNCANPGGELARHGWDDLDDTLFFNQTSSVECITGCTGTWTVDRL